MQLVVGRVPAGFEPALKSSHLWHSAAEDRYQEVIFQTAKLVTQAYNILYNTPIQSVGYYLESLHVY